VKKEPIITFENLAAYEHDIVRDGKRYDINMKVMTGTLEEKHKNIDPEKGIPALRRKFNLVFLFLDGEHDVQVGLDYRWLKKNDLVIVPENMVLQSPNVRNCKGYCIHFTTDFLQPLVPGNLSEQFPFFDLQAEHFINLSDEDSNIIQQSFRDIIAEFQRFSYEKDYLLRNYIHILLLRIREIYKTTSKNKDKASSRAMTLANQFKHLVEQNFINIRSVKQYADMMHITPKNLSDNVKEALGKSPIEMIHEMLLLEAKVLLRSTDMTAAQIALHLNFEDQSHFSRFIKQHCGCPPMELKKKL
jgi:AraC family transcriptional regulator, transcriptional activator of pobA